MRFFLWLPCKDFWANALVCHCRQLEEEEEGVSGAMMVPLLKDKALFVTCMQ